jgi:hypothetical protein
MVYQCKLHIADLYPAERTSNWFRDSQDNHTGRTDRKRRTKSRRSAAASKRNSMDGSRG